MESYDEVDIKKSHHSMLIIQALDPLADLVFAKDVWMVRASIGIAEVGVPAVMSGTFYVHADPNQAVIGYLITLQAVKPPQYVVVGQTDRYAVRWNGAAFARVENDG